MDQEEDPLRGFTELTDLFTDLRTGYTILEEDTVTQSAEEVRSLEDPQKIIAVHMRGETGWVEEET